MEFFSKDYLKIKIVYGIYILLSFIVLVLVKDFLFALGFIDNTNFIFILQWLKTPEDKFNR